MSLRQLCCIWPPIPRVSYHSCSEVGDHEKSIGSQGVGEEGGKEVGDGNARQCCENLGMEQSDTQGSSDLRENVWWLTSSTM